MFLKGFAVLAQFFSKRTYLCRFQIPLNLTSAAVYVKCYWSNSAGFRLNWVHQAFSRVFAVKHAEAHRVHGWKRICFVNEWLLNVDFLFFQIVFYDFLPLESERGLCVLATTVFALTAKVERAGFYHIFVRHREPLPYSV
jgi:hypothetical protein